MDTHHNPETLKYHSVVRGVGESFCSALLRAGLHPTTARFVTFPDDGGLGTVQFSAKRLSVLYARFLKERRTVPPENGPQYLAVALTGPGSSHVPSGNQIMYLVLGWKPGDRLDDWPLRSHVAYLYD